MTTITEWLESMTEAPRTGSSSPCRRGCCWSPFGNSGAASQLCICHTQETR